MIVQLSCTVMYTGLEARREGRSASCIRKISIIFISCAVDYCDWRHYLTIEIIQTSDDIQQFLMVWYRNNTVYT